MSFHNQRLKKKLGHIVLNLEVSDGWGWRWVVGSNCKVCRKWKRRADPFCRRFLEALPNYQSQIKVSETSQLWTFLHKNNLFNCKRFHQFYKRWTLSLSLMDSFEHFRYAEHLSRGLLSSKTMTVRVYIHVHNYIYTKCICIVCI